MLQCGEADSSIVVAFTREPVVQAYNASGSLRWKIRIAGAQGVDVDVTNEKSITYRVPADGADVLTFLGTFDRTHVLVQTRRFHSKERPSLERPETSTISLDLRDGREDVRGQGLPVIVGGTAADVFVFDTTEPFGLRAAHIVVKKGRD